MRAIPICRAMSAMAAVVWLACGAGAASAVPQQTKSLFSAGGAAATGGTLRVSGNLGDVLAGPSAQAPAQVWSGFWSPAAGANVGVGPGPLSATFLGQPQPNPARHSAAIEFSVERASRVELRIYDLAGRLVRELASGVRPPGVHRETWNLRSDAGARVPAGIYFSRLSAASAGAVRKIVVLD